jgi:hypothetical protein
MLQGKTAIKRYAQQNFHKTTDIKSRLEDVILGQGSARSEMMMRRKGSTIKSIIICKIKTTAFQTWHMNRLMLGLLL